MLDRLRAGESVAVVTDAGMPGISDPGERHGAGRGRRRHRGRRRARAVGRHRRARRQRAARRRFVFEGFLPRSGSGRTERLAELAGERRTIVLYEAPHRLARTLADLAGAAAATGGSSSVRELTKLHEEMWRASSPTPWPRGRRCRAPWRARDRDRRCAARAPPRPTTPTSPPPCIGFAEGLSTRDAVAEVASAFDVPKRRVYDLAVTPPSRHL